jgi:hypothetical protein
MDFMSIPARCFGAPSARAARDNFRRLVFAVEVASAPGSRHAWWRGVGWQMNAIETS